MSDQRPFYFRYFTKSRFTMVLGVSLAIHLLIGTFFGGTVIFDILTTPEPQLEAPPIPESIDPIKREYKVSMKRSQQQSAAPLPIPIVADVPSDVSLDNIDLNISNPRSDVRIRGAGQGDGVGKGFGNGFGDAAGFDLDIEIEFFGARGGGQKLVFVIDVSQSLRGRDDRTKERIMRKEATRVIEELPPGIDFNVIFFAGPAWPAFDDLDEWADEFVTTGDDADTFRPKDWDDLKKLGYYGSGTGARHRAIRAIRDTDLVYGTVFDLPMFMALNMDPTPDTIFFMTDGSTSDERGIDQIRKMVEQMDRAGKKVPTIHTVGLGTSGNRQLDEIAALTRKGTATYLTPEDFRKKYGDISFPDSDEERNSGVRIERVPADRYPIEFDME